MTEDFLRQVMIIVFSCPIEQHMNIFKHWDVSTRFLHTLLPEQLKKLFLKSLFVFGNTLLCVLIDYDCSVEFLLIADVIFATIDLLIVSLEEGWKSWLDLLKIIAN